MCSYESSSTNEQNEDSGIEKELLNIFEECDVNGTDCVKVSQLIDKIKFFLQGSENTQEILAVVKLKLDPHGNKTFISKEYFIQCVSEWLDSKQQQPADGDDDDDNDNVFLPIADTNEDEINCSFDRGMKNGQNIYHSTPIIKKPMCLRKARTIDVYLSQPDSPGVSIEAHTVLENEIKDMKQDMLAIVRERDRLEMTVSDLRNRISLIEKKNSVNESLLTQTVNKLKTEVEKKRELEKYNEELIKMNNDTEKEMAHVNKKVTSLVKTCEDQRAQNCILEQMNLRLELLKCKSSATKAEEKYLQMKLNVDHWLKNFGDMQKNMKGSLGSPEEISLISTNVFGFSPVKYENSLMAEIGTQLDVKNGNQTDEDCAMYETLSTQTDFVDTKHYYEDTASQTEDNVTVRNKRRRVCEECIQESLTCVYLSQVVDHWTQTLSNGGVIDSASQTDDTSKRTCSVSCGDNTSFDCQKICKAPDTRRRGKKWIWFGVTGVTFIVIFCLLFDTVMKWSCNSPCCMKSGQYLWSLKKLFPSCKRNAVPV